MQPPVPAGNSSHKPRGWNQTVQAPAGPRAGRGPDPQDPRGLAGHQGNVELIEGHGQSIAKRLDDSFLSRPAVEESRNPVARLKRRVGVILPARENSRGDAV